MWSNELLNCFRCPVYTRAQNQNTSCAPDSCYDNQVITPIGTCSICRINLKPDVTKKECI